MPPPPCRTHSSTSSLPPPARLDAVLAEAATWPHVTVQASRIAVEGSRALVLTDDVDTGPSDAFLIGREFCHGHAGGDSSLHAALPPHLARSAQEAGWGEPHYLVHTHQAPPSITMLYAPRDQAERDVILRLVRASYEFALGVTDRADVGAAMP